MSLSLNGSGQYAWRNNAIAGSSPQPFSLVCFFKPSNVTSFFALLWHGDQHDSPAVDFGLLEAAGTVAGDPLRARDRDGGTSRIASGDQYDASNWQLGVAVFTGASSRSVSLDGANLTAETSTNAAMSGHDSFAVGFTLNFNADDYNGLIAEVAVFDRALDNDDIAELWNSGGPFVKPSNLSSGAPVSYWPLLNDANDDESTNHLTLVGSPSFNSDHPGMITEVSLSGSLSSSGSLAQRADKPIVGALSSVGAVVNAAIKKVAIVGTLSIGGSIVKRGDKALAASMNSSGVIVREVRQNLASMLSSSGALAKEISHSLAATLSSAGALANQARKDFAGMLTSAGSVANSATKNVSLAGALTSAGAIVQQVNKSIAASMSSSGAIVQQVNKSIAASMSSSGAIVQKINKGLVGTLTSAGSIANQVNKTITGVLTSAGAVATVAFKNVVLAGTLSISGTVANQTQKAFSGTLSSAGSVVKQINKSISATLSISGAVVKQVNSALAGTLTSAGSLAKRVDKAITGTLSIVGALTEALVGGTAVASRVFLLGVHNATALLKGIHNAATTLLGRNNPGLIGPNIKGNSEMAKEHTVKQSDGVFSFEDKVLIYDITDENDSPETMTGWTLEMEFAQRDGTSLFTISGANISITNGSGTDDRARVTVAKSNWSSLTEGWYHHSLRRTDSDNERVLSHGDFYLNVLP